MNPFKYGTIVEGEYFTDRKVELPILKQKLDSPNHIILISPRRYGKSSLVQKCLNEINRSYIWVDLMYTVSVQDLVVKLLKSALRTFSIEKIRYYLSHFRIIPTISTNTLTGDWQFGFQPTVDNSVLLEDVFQMIENMGSQNRMIVVIDEFQEVQKIDKNLDKQLRSIMQHQKNVNYIFMGSQESMMETIFEKKKSPFYHFGQLMRLKKIPYDEFYTFLFDRLPAVRFKDDLVNQILNFTHCHPYYTQQLASQIWDVITFEMRQEKIVETAIDELVQLRDLDYERLWETFNLVDKGVMFSLANGENPMQDKQRATSTTYSAIKRLLKSGYIIKEDNYEFEDPFFLKWLQKRNS